MAIDLARLAAQIMRERGLEPEFSAEEMQELATINHPAFSSSGYAEHLNEAKIPSLRRVVRIPKYWDRIVQVAADLGFKLPEEPDSKALEEFLIKRKKADPDSFPDLSLTIIKLLGRG